MLDIDEQNFAEVVQQSQQVPVVVDFYADWCEPCKAIAPVLDKLEAEYQGQVLFARVNADEQQAICAQFGVRNLPNLKLVYQGQIVSELAGAHPESKIRDFLAPVLGQVPAGSNVEGMLEAIAQAREAGDLEAAMHILQQLAQEQPEEKKHIVLLVDLLLDMGQAEEARKALESVDKEVEGYARVRARLDFIERVTELEDPGSLEERYRKNPEDLELNFNYGLLLVSRGQLEEAMDRFLFVMQRDREFREDGAKQTMLELFEMMGRDDPLASLYRRKLYNLLH